MLPGTRWLNFVVPLGVYVLGVLAFFRGQILSNFDLLFGDRGDARFIAFIHEHLYQWLCGRSALLSPPFFFDQAGTLGYGDVFLLDQFIYAPLRLVGCEPLLALSLMTLVLSTLSFFFLYEFLRRLNSSVLLASFGAFIFTFANNLYLTAFASHLQLFAVYFIPIIVYCVLVAISEFRRRPLRAYLFATFAAGLFGLLFSTGYYIAWFFGIGLLIFVPIAVLAAWPEVWAWWSKRPNHAVGLVIVATLSFCSALSIFAAIYGPALTLGMKRSFAEYLFFAPRPNDIFNVGTQNLIWSRPIGALHLVDDNRLNNGELWFAITPAVQILLLASTVLTFRTRFWPSASSGRISRAIVIASAGVCITLFLLVVSINKYSLFFVLYKTVPGATAIRAGYRGAIVANVFAATAIALTFDRIFSLLFQEKRMLFRVEKVGALVVLLLLAAFEQINLAQASRMSIKFEREHFSAVTKAPPECRSFYIAPELNHLPYDVQIDAMMVAVEQRLPTINGYSGFFPPGWNFYDIQAIDYEQKARHWAVERGIANGLCRLDVESGTWVLVSNFD